MLNLARSKLLFVPSTEIKRIGSTLRKLELDDNLLSDDPFIIYDQQGNVKERIESLPFEGSYSFAFLFSGLDLDEQFASLCDRFQCASCP